MTYGGLKNEHATSGRSMICTSAVPFAGMIVKVTDAANTCDLAIGSEDAIGFTTTSTVPNPELMAGTAAVAGELVSAFPLRTGVVFESPVAAGADIAIGDKVALDKTSAGFVAGLTDQTIYYGIALSAADNTVGENGDMFVTIIGYRNKA